MRDLAVQDVEVGTTLRYDPSKHLETQLLHSSAQTPAAGGAEAADWQASGWLKDGETLNLGIESRLSEPARALVFGGSSDHPTLNGRNGMAVEFQLQWVDESGVPVHERKLFVPFYVNTRPAWGTWVGMLLTAIVVIGGGFFGYLRLIRWLKTRHRADSARETHKGLVKVATSSGTAAPPPSASSETPTGSPGASAPGVSAKDFLPKKKRGH